VIQATARKQRGETMKIDQDILDLNLEAVQFKLAADEGWELERIELGTLAYRAFLQVIRDSDSGGNVAPNRDIDITWHHHILDTRAYHEDCQRLFGRYLHHFPYSGMFGESDAAAQQARVARTIALINQKLT